MNVRTTTFGLIAAAAGLAAMLASTTASATDSQTRSVTVSYRDAQLRNSAGADKLLQRVSGAAQTVCTIPGALPYDYESREFHSCRQNAIEHAVEQVNRPTLTAAYNRHFPQDALRAAAALKQQRPGGSVPG
jgi:UrcA family protein